MTNIKELLGQITAYARLQVAIVAEVEALQARVYSLEEKVKLKDASIKELQKEVFSLRLSKVTGADKIV